jgi:hypothetical protein
LEAGDYEGLPTETIFKAILELDKEGAQVSYESIEAKIEGHAESLASLPVVFLNDSLHADEEEFTAEKCVSSLKLMRINRRIDELNASLANAERANNAEEIGQLLKEHLELTRRRDELLPKAEAMQIGH